MTVTNIVADLINSGILYEAEYDEAYSGIGRKPVSVRPVEDSLLSVGIRIGHNGIRVASISSTATVRFTKQFRIDESDTAETVLEKITKGVSAVMHYERGNRLLGIGVASIGPVDSESGTVLSPPNFYGIRNLPVRDALARITDLPVEMLNDDPAAALAEHMYANPNGYRDFLCIGLSHAGVGAGIIVGDRFYAGHSGFGAEVGHMTVDINGPLCDCGNRGCLETYINISSIIARVVEKERANGVIRKAPPSFSDVVQRAYEGDSVCSPVMQQVYRHLGAGLVSLSNIFQPEAIIITNQSAEGGLQFAKELEKIVNQGVLFKCLQKISVEISKLGADGVIIGSAALVFRRLFSGEIVL